MQLNPPLRFGTDGWRGIIADQFTFERLGLVAPIAAQVLAETFGKDNHNPTVIVGYDRRFLSLEFAQFTAEVLAKSGFDVMLAADFAPTPAFSWAAYSQGAVGALVITASHNPAIYNGLKIKGAFGGSVGADFTQKVEARVNAGEKLPNAKPGSIQLFDPWQSYCNQLRSKVNIDLIKQKIESGELGLFSDVMHGAAAGGLGRILDLSPELIQELRANRDPMFGGVAPEPIAINLSEIIDLIKNLSQTKVPSPQLKVGFVFDGDSDRIAAIDSNGNFLSSQILIPILIQHLYQVRAERGEIIKTISGSDLIAKVASLYQLSVHETPVGYKYIADRMLSGHKAILGGEESGGIGYGNHIPERDALLSALYVLEAIAYSGKDLTTLYQNLQQQTGFFSSYDRLDKHLPDLDSQNILIEYLQTNPLTHISDRQVVSINNRDGFKFRLVDGSWLMIRFSGTEPVLRLYCEADCQASVAHSLNWISEWVDNLIS